MTYLEALTWFTRRKKMCLSDRCQDAENIAIIAIAELISRQPDAVPRVISLDELMNTSGCGYVEAWFEAEPGEGMQEEKVLIECAWCRGSYVTEDGDISNPVYIRGQYNRRYGLRVWSARPTDEQRKAVEWDDEA